MTLAMLLSRPVSLQGVMVCHREQGKAAYR
jgi:hypothetical protein